MLTRRTLLRSGAATLAGASLGPLFAAQFAGADPAAVLARPTAAQAAWHDLELEMFIHFGPATWQDRQHDNLSTPLSAINPQQLDTDQWAEVAVGMGARQIVFVAKHDGGFCWWPTEATTNSVAHTPWRDGKGDVMKDLAASCRKHGLKLGVYLSPADRALGIAAGGRAKTPEGQEQYNKIYRQQLTELLSRYGEIREVWFDGSNVVPVADILRRYAPEAMVFQGPQATIRWVGNELGTAPYPAWNALPLDKAKSGLATAFDGDPGGAAWLPNECPARIRAEWFWTTKNAGTLKSVAQLMEMYYGSIGHGAVLLPNQTPDTTGLIPDTDARRGAEFRAEVQRRFGRALAETAGHGTELELALGRPTKIDHVITMENLPDGERVREYVIEGLAEGRWKTLCDGTAIGHKKIDRFAPATVERVRLRCPRAVGEPRIRKLAVYCVYGDTAPAEIRAELSAQTSTLWKWSGENLKADWTPVRIDLTPFCQEAGVYVIELVPESGPLPEVQSLDLYDGQGVKLDRFLRRRQGQNQRLRYEVTITAEGSIHELRGLARRGPEDSVRGRMTICWRSE